MTSLRKADPETIRVSKGSQMEDRERILIIEDESSMAKQLKWGLADAYEVTVATMAQEARVALEREPPVAVLLDLGLPPEPDTARIGLKLLEEIVTAHADIKVIVTTGNTDRHNALKAVSLGAYDYYQKPVDIEELKVILRRAIHLSHLERQVDELRQQVSCQEHFDGMIASSAPMMQLFAMARKAARSDYPVLIQGESGTGKERLAMALHRLSPRSERPCVIVDCGAIPENLLESELFGHEKGAFTGAHARQIGKLERAMRGTVVLDEIGEIPLGLQVKLLRFLQEGTIERIGGREVLQVDARVIAVTNMNLQAAVSEERFREDLYYRLNVVTLLVPPLRERQEDITLLARYFLETYSRELGPAFRGFSPEAMDAIMAYAWPGNVREMQTAAKISVLGASFVSSQ